jgi:hypothetical protein
LGILTNTYRFVCADFNRATIPHITGTIGYAETQSPAFLNAVRQNLGHEPIDTTLSSYGQQSMADQRKNISSVQFD